MKIGGHIAPTENHATLAITTIRNTYLPILPITCLTTNQGQEK